MQIGQSIPSWKKRDPYGIYLRLLKYSALGSLLSYGLEIMTYLIIRTKAIVMKIVNKMMTARVTRRNQWMNSESYFL